MHGGVHPREVGAPHGPGVARDGVRKNQLLDKPNKLYMSYYYLSSCTA